MDLDQNQYQIIVESSPNMIWRSGLDALCNYFNATWLNFTGKTMDQEVGNGWVDGVHPEDVERCVKIYLDAFKKQEPFEMDYRLKRHDGVYRWINDRGVPFYVGDRQFAGYIGSCMDVTEKVEGQKLREMAQQDGLTKLLNRQYFEQLGKIEFAKAQRFSTGLTLAMIDIDDFKRINDTYGHLTGDDVLKEMAQTMRSMIRDFDLLARFGGDEFVLLMTNTNLSDANALIQRLDQAIKNNVVRSGDQEIKVSASFGIHQLNGEENLEKVLIEADRRLYEAKRRIKSNDDFD